MGNRLAVCFMRKKLRISGIGSKRASAKTLADSAATAAWLMSYFGPDKEGSTEDDPYVRQVERWPVPLGIMKIEKILDVAQA